MLAHKIETFQNENDVVVRVNELKSKGIQENNVTVITDKKPESSILADRLRVNYKEAKGSFGDKVSALFSGDDPEEKTLQKLNLNQTETDRYVDELKNGKILLFVDPSAREKLQSEANANNKALSPAEKNRPVTGAGNAQPGTTASADQNLYSSKDDTRRAGGDRQAIEARNTQPGNKDNPKTSQTEQMELHEEVVDVDTNSVKSGAVDVEKRTVTDQEEFDVPVTNQEVNIERRPVNKVSEPDKNTGAYAEKDGIHVPVYEEKVDVNKKDIVKEEIVVNKKDVNDNVHVNEKVRREEAEIKDSTKNNKDLK
ncbi:conserved domain-containing protein [Terribacillus halophilus]|uniref:Conserved domain-containing protein n=1 Tax=Terribacillus halophilus TaxID=361279 RepID=A0A1G6UAK5_9BACI|nr:DUF2382 domain-containing protein [Terribacillus halophilus]SDD38408.1 conserved domain-containing protein [Terribacillus halophilus]